MMVDDRLLRRQLTNLERAQLPFAAANALNDTAAEALSAVQDLMDVVFDRPTRFARNAFMVWRANKRTLEARVQERPSVGPRHFLKVQEAGGARPQTGLERLLSSKVATSVPLQAAVPADNARLDAFGNWSAGERNQALSGIGAQRDARANTTAASGRRSRAKGRAKYFVPKVGLPPGIYKRDGGGISMVLAFTSKVPSYAPRFRFYEGVAEVWEARLPDHLDRRLAEAVASAR
jgi:hypothetical protein